MAWEIEFTDQFDEWWETLTVDEQADVAHYVHQLEQRGPGLAFPYSSGVIGSRHGVMRVVAGSERW